METIVTDRRNWKGNLGAESDPLFLATIKVLSSRFVVQLQIETSRGDESAGDMIYVQRFSLYFFISFRDWNNNALPRVSQPDRWDFNKEQWIEIAWMLRAEMTTHFGAGSPSASHSMMKGFSVSPYDATWNNISSAIGCLIIRGGEWTEKKVVG